MRPTKCRFIDQSPDVDYFKPRGIPLLELEEVNLTLDEFETLRLADLKGLYQEQACREMKISRATFGKILAKAHTKVADALINGKAIRIEGGVYSMRRRNQRRRREGCGSLKNEVEAPGISTDDQNVRIAQFRQRRCRRRGK